MDNYSDGDHINKKFFNYFEYIDFNGARLHTSICLPKKEWKFPTVIMRTPYVDSFENTDPLEMARPYVKGKMTATLRVKSNCEDTCFYVRLSLTKNN